MQAKGGPNAALLESIRAAAHAAIEAGDGAAAVELMRLIEQRRPTGASGSKASVRGARSGPAPRAAVGPSAVASLDAARRRRDEGGAK